jgi:fumarate hydratase class I
MRHLRDLRESMLRLIELTVTTLPYDVFNAIDSAYRKESSFGLPSLALSMMRANAIAAMQYRSPMCEDTGVATFYVRCGNRL